MTAIDQRFAELRRQGHKALIPFVTAGDPDLEFTGALLRELDRLGCGLCELGIPYSDPIADGPVIQASYTRALDRRLRLADIFAAAQCWLPQMRSPLVTMVSYAIALRHGLEGFVRAARAAGVAGAIVPDLPVEEAEELARVCHDHDFSLVQLVTPTTPPERAVRIAATSSGFLYYVSVAGITGERRELPSDLADQVRWLRNQTDLPICIGFGISRPDQVRLLAPVADGVIVGSALVRHLADVESLGRPQVLTRISGLARQLLEALHSVKLDLPESP